MKNYSKDISKFKRKKNLGILIKLFIVFDNKSLINF